MNVETEVFVNSLHSDSRLRNYVGKIKRVEGQKAFVEMNTTIRKGSFAFTGGWFQLRDLSPLQRVIA
jgi:hypothetical protein